MKKSTGLLNSNQVRVRIEELWVNAYLGVHAREQKKRRRIPVYIEFEYEQPNTDSLARALDYRDVRDNERKPVTVKYLSGAKEAFG